MSGGQTLEQRLTAQFAPPCTRDQLARNLLLTAWDAVSAEGGVFAKAWVPAAERWLEAYDERNPLPDNRGDGSAC